VIFDFDAMPRPSPGWSPPAPAPRLSQQPTLGGARVSVQAGHVSDEPVPLSWGMVPASPVRTLLHEATDTTISQAMHPDERLAAYIPAAASGPTAISAVSLYLGRDSGTTGSVTVEVWDADAVTGKPGRCVGVLGRLAMSEITPTGAWVTIRSDAAWPLDGGGWLVLNGDELTLNTVQWGRDNVTADSLCIYSAGAWGAIGTGVCAMRLWRGGVFEILRGLLLAYQGGFEWEIDLEDGHAYYGLVADVSGAWRQKPLPENNYAGQAENVKCSLLLTEDASASGTLSSGGEPVPQIKSLSFPIKSPSIADDLLLMRTPRAMTIVRVSALAQGGTEVVGGLDEVAGDGVTLESAVDADWTIGTTELVDDDFTNPDLDAGDWLRWHTTSVTGAVEFLTVTVDYYHS
jgi:hypothetical protein